MQQEDNVNHPAHYKGHPSGIECIQVTEHMGVNLGNAVKYIWRCDLKKDAVEDLEKAAWYIQREISKRLNQLAVANREECESVEIKQSFNITLNAGLSAESFCALMNEGFPRNAK